MRHPAGETITVIRLGAAVPGEFTDLGDPVLAEPTSFEIGDVAISPAGSVETVSAPGVFVVTGYDLFCPYDAPMLLPSDRFTIRGTPGWQMSGESIGAGWRNPFDGRGRGVVINVKRGN